ncbi:bifunctional DNA-formamidopyrimidine glycosylase/DNA-(apurinic or apyrimidinic site) lyase [uncultured Megasphaera sp.]|uniref:bifunctional DNA-formamidopyrimidine glycosylase/DNA-(apurinic or apyrimidinic site) lyase n=1 Tax=uncultured Megasphaera sp. TaxID=165188 RepID=UPI00266FAC8B|nr:bifunctional DNA-formamidopyrimidine glycosylase/DNA-(apurinic or apyrimidinic site) lyase [uncultured Megasphaera sp.]
MPELPEVETVRRYLAASLPGKSITAVDVQLPRLIRNRTAEDFAASLPGCTFTAVARRGKYLSLMLDSPWRLLVHLRMTGRLIYESDTTAPLPPYTRIVFTLNEGRLVYGDVRTFGCLWIVPAAGPTGISGYDSLGPDGLSEDFTADYLWQQVHGSRRLIKALLLDQTCLAGLGNIYADEALFLAGIRPSRRCSRVTRKESRRLYEAIRTVLTEGLENGGTTVFNFIDGSGKEGKNQENLRVYGREGQPCPVCGATTIVYKKQGGRGTHYCPVCQK